MIKKFINVKKTDDADVVFISAPYEKTASFHKGTKNGPKKILGCLNCQLDWFDRKLKVETIDFIKNAHIELKNPDKLSPENFLKKTRQICEKLVSKNKFIFLLGGEHTVSLGHLQALAKKHNPRETTILQIDAHCDLRDNDSDYNDKNPSRLAHSAVMRRVSELGYNLVQVGIRTYSKEEYEYFKNPKNKVKVFEWGMEKKPKREEILRSIKTKKVYLSIDVDGFDPSVMPGTGTPVPGGLKWNYGLKLIEEFINKFTLIGADIVEVSPARDSVLTEYASAQLAYAIITNKFKNKLFKS
ncbi:agmatinase [Candidatus Nomurabacteria bacterium RIFCSPHIGHO2_02_FULL_41_18]|uniref:Agmatinase n=1 Tax=Candidatus Nomurabacteria bacterium RIFCSPHIGHO2_02_FULL_41_18 TaxID=1801754 RepID=A0A1F6W5C7_9BACT|nr:MAG: agmatinase [Candidatus Nomurabacteria bacterium RIFCSPHIGHO2_01_FULL_41_71]OGI77044.1 MAG: agmatinase [Candidatus Nomurabacteria bacterium RIFCSPHIGHO2_02_FULL_41_18]OGI90152.1 MAG: agmatinase [Candidatus Nomurabacteria bacterium RIFCSPLOWO2_01_FULL_41_52b]OGJ00518.1 MAG: agmatinase [Candidatus Nomurabacteria bacterium RIFCSPLOWO2_02_FULL_41_9]